MSQSARWMTFLQQRQKDIDKTNALCQKCLEKGHWTYECKNPRKYLQRESRTKEMIKNMKTNRKRTLAQEKNKVKKKRKSSTSSSSSSSSSSSGTSDSSSDSDSSSSSSSSLSARKSSLSSSNDSSDSEDVEK